MTFGPKSIQLFPGEPIWSPCAGLLKTKQKRLNVVSDRPLFVSLLCVFKEACLNSVYVEHSLYIIFKVWISTTMPANPTKIWKWLSPVSFSVTSVYIMKNWILFRRTVHFLLIYFPFVNQCISGSALITVFVPISAHVLSLISNRQLKKGVFNTLIIDEPQHLDSYLRILCHSKCSMLGSFLSLPPTSP